MPTTDMHALPIRINTQLLGERWLYEQEVKDDTIVTATWSRTPTSGSSILSTTVNSTTTRVLFEVTTAGSYLLRVDLTLASGQELFGLVRVFGRIVPT